MSDLPYLRAYSGALQEQVRALLSDGGSGLATGRTAAVGRRLTRVSGSSQPGRVRR